MHRGIVRTFDHHRGVGMIEEEDGRREVRVHRSGIAHNQPPDLHPGDVVEYEVGRSRYGGFTAVHVVRVGWEDEGDSPGEWTF